ncbi:DNA-directed RNA polymerase subunit beta' [Candidatus Uhrbacteria bacterium]|nr:DNA-directed RNA polymerase subunit beta' [Candidatus Uhrbacteria bacterium]
MMQEQSKDSISSFDFSAIRLRLASPNDIHRWSYGEVTKPETINYRTQRPEKDGLFSERIFGPTKDWECYCGKYKKIRYKGIVCDKCGVEVTRSIVRRERMGHIDLLAPVSHIWFLRGVPSKIGMALDISVQNLEKIIYFASFIIIDVDDELKAHTLEQVREEAKTKRKQLDDEYNRHGNQLRSKLQQQTKADEKTGIERQIEDLMKMKAETQHTLDEKVRSAEEEVKNIKPMRILSENAYRDLSLKYGHIFSAGIGAEAIHTLLARLDMPTLAQTLEKEIEESQGVKKEKLVRRAKLIRSFMTNAIRPEWEILTAIPVIPPDLRPMVALDGGRFATSDLNDLYRRVINRNNRLRQLVELKAPEVICRNEKRMLQEAVDALIDNSARHGKTVIASTGQKRVLKSLADMLKGKRGRFRQNLLGKRIDYSGRSVIVVGPKLKLHQCGLPKKMALDLFKPFIMSQLIKREYVYNVRSASRFIESGRDEVWDILEEIVKESYVLLNRAPTLHRLGIQAFKPILIEGKAIQIHPLVCTAFNADFDGDQMAVHVPLSEEARQEARDLMLASRNLLKPATGQPIALPTQDMIWGAFYMTNISDEEFARAEQDVRKISDERTAELEYAMGRIGLRERIFVRPSVELRGRLPEKDMEKRFIETSVGRILFNNILPNDILFYNNRVDKKNMQEIVAQCLERCGMERVAVILDNIKELSGRYLTQSGLSFGMDDIPILSEKTDIIKQAEQKIDEIETQYEMGLLTFQERRSKIITECIELAVKSSFKEGLGVLEYFISTHGARKGLADTALRTSSAGYLTRRLVDVSQDVVINIHDCKDSEGALMIKEESDAIDINFYDRLIGRTAAESIADASGTVIVSKGALITKEHIRVLRDAHIETVRIRSILSCKASKGLCQKCYGVDLAYNILAKPGTAVGIIAAQSLGEPGTQLTMRTFHTGGVAGLDITQGLPRVEELFEARIPKNKAVIVEVSGKVSISDKQKSVVSAESGKEVLKSGAGQRIVSITYEGTEEDVYKLSKRSANQQKNEDEKKKRSAKAKKSAEILVKDGQEITEGAILWISEDGNEIAARRAGVVRSEKNVIKVLVSAHNIKEYIIPPGAYLVVKDGDLVAAGDFLTEGSADLQLIYKYRGKLETQKLIINEIQKIYSSQGQKLSDKHIEIIVRQMFSRVYVLDTGDTDLLSGEIVELSEFLEANAIAHTEQKQEAHGQELLMGITKASLSTRSWLSAASFQETARVLINAAITGKPDRLEGLKENVIIGRLIPVGTGYRVREGT